MGCGKTLNLITTSYSYEEHGKKTIIFKPALDNRDGNNIIKSRTGFQKEVILISENDNIFDITSDIIKNGRIHCVLVDEAQFLKKHHIFQLSNIVDKLNITVIAYGLRSDFKLNSFEGSNQLMVMADLEEIKTICSECGERKASVNARYSDNKIVIKGQQIQLGGNESYKPLCRKCYKDLTNN